MISFMRSRLHRRNQRNGGPRHFVLAALAVLSAIPDAAYPQEAQVPHEMLIRHVDHIMIGGDDPEKYFLLFSQKLSLPVAGPFQQFDTFASGSVSFGNLVVEFGRGPHFRPGLTGVALDPYSLPKILAALDSRGVAHTVPAPAYRKDSQGEYLAYTTVGFPILAPGNVFLCQFNSDMVRRFAGQLSHQERRAKYLSDLQGRGGGPLGIESVMELVIGVRDLAAGQRGWSILLGPSLAGQEGVWRIGSGPAIHLVASHEDRLMYLRVKVKSVATARAFLKSEQLLGLDAEREISIDRSGSGGADIRFVQ